MTSISEQVSIILSNDLLAAELKLALFTSALNSYRHDSCLRPFPNIFGDTCDKNIAVKQMKSLLSEFRPLAEMVNIISLMSEDCQKMIHWALDSKIYSSKTCNKHVFDDVQKKTGCSSYQVQPDYIFEIKYNTFSSQKFDDLAKMYGVKYGFHGSRMDNFHSIVNNGLQVHMVKNAVFGEGVYLSEDLSVSMPYISSGFTWQHSKLGQQISCVAVCEVLDHPGVKCTMKTVNGANRSRANNSEAGEVPKKYFVVTSSDLVRVKYIFVFTDKTEKRNSAKCGMLCFRYPVLSIMLAYMLLLAFVSIWNSKTFQLIWRNYWYKKKF
ncbi:protein mono-ADP-ribosyltransferase PARP16 [Hydra vulgaris]|uniref:Poly [ADP-ribose] polymerase n=1 Tax=Hydra vulgaris TaxID=6087 RepID=T2M900_HYDVU|nr:protein mono-ADP-ribosyltransferase PARP16 [Hydra vulgaris]XP_047139815.1 protein mono-ADP-ribosyltransferase PARP16 [Hydra vulgaris]